MKTYVKYKIIIVIILSITAILTSTKLFMTYSKYKSGKDFDAKATVGALQCDVVIDTNESYVENNETYFLLTVKNSKENIVTNTDISYVLTIKNQEGSSGLFNYIDTDGNTHEEYSETLIIEEHSLGKTKEEELFKIKVKTNSENKEKVNFIVDLNAYQKKME